MEIFEGSKLKGIYVLKLIWANAQGENSQSEHPNRPPRGAPRLVCLPETNVRPPQGTIGTRSGRSKSVIGAYGRGLPLLADHQIIVPELCHNGWDLWDTNHGPPQPGVCRIRTTARTSRHSNFGTIWTSNFPKVPKSIYGSSPIDFEE